MEEIKKTASEIQATVQAPVKKTRYWLWFGLTFALIMWASFFRWSITSSYYTESSFGIKIIYNILTPLFHVIYIPIWFDDNNWMRIVGFYIALASENVPFLMILYPILLILLYFFIGLIVGKIFSKTKSNPTVFAIFLLITTCFITYRLHNFKQKYYPSQTRDCFVYSTEFEQWSCISHLAREKKDIDMCRDMPNKERIYECYSMVAHEVREYGICDKMPFWEGEEYAYLHKTACRDDIASIRYECDKISTEELRDFCYSEKSRSIRLYSKQDACIRFRETLGLKHLIPTCESFKAGTITIADLCAKITNTEKKKSCISDSIEGYSIQFGAEKPEPVEWLYGPGTPETEEEIKNRPKPREEQIQNEISEESWTVEIEENEEVILAEPSCKDLDDGMVASKKWVIVMDNWKHFEDVCTVKTWESYKTATSCSGDSCYIEEGYCFGETTTPESLPTNILPCPNGCNNWICKIDNTKEGTYTTFCNNIVQENDPEYQTWKDRIEKQFPGLYVNIMGAYCKINNGNTVVSFSYSSSSGEDKQRIALFNKRGQYIKFTDNLDCRFDSGNYFRFQNESNGLISMVCENNFTRGNWNGVYEKIRSSTFYTLDLSTLESELMSEK